MKPRIYLPALAVLAAVAVMGAIVSRDQGSNDVDESGTSANPSATNGKTAGSDKSSKRGPQSGKGQEEPSPGSTLIPADFVSYSIAIEDLDDPRPQDCPLVRGELCTAHLRGKYRLTNHANAKIRVSVFEDENDLASKVVDLAVPKGASDWFIDFKYIVGKEAGKVRFKVQLIGPEDQLLHEASSKIPYFRVRA